MLSTAAPHLVEHDPTNPNWFSRGCTLGAIGGAMIAVGFLIALSLAGQDEWSMLVPEAILGMPAGAGAGAAEAVLALSVLHLLPHRALALRWPAALVAASVAAAVPLLLTFHAGMPTAAGGIWIGLGLAAAAFVAGAALTPIALRPRSRR